MKFNDPKSRLYKNIHCFDVIYYWHQVNVIIDVPVVDRALNELYCKEEKKKR